MSENPLEDLTVIKGIGPVWQKRLRESLGIRTFADLADLSCADLLSQLEAIGQPLPTMSECEAWISQAQKLVETKKTKTSALKEEKGGQNNPPAAQEKWTPFATFVVEYLGRQVEGGQKQGGTKVHHAETDTNADWPGIVTIEPCDWMLKQAGQSETTPPDMLQLIEAARRQKEHRLEQEIEDQRKAAKKIIDKERTEARKELEQEIKQGRAFLKKELEDIRTEAALRLEDELKEERIQGQKKIQNEFDEKQEAARQAFEQQLEEERAAAKKELRQELDDMRTSSRLALDKQIEAERAQVKKGLEQELDDERTTARQELDTQLESERAQAKKELEQELERNRAEAMEELDKQLEAERTKAREGLEKELFEMRSQVMLELEKKIEEGQLVTPLEIGQPPMGDESQPSPEVPETILAEPQETTPPLDQETLPEPVALPYINLAIKELKAYQPSGASEPAQIVYPGQSFDYPLSSDEALSIELSFELAEQTLQEISNQKITYYVQLFSQDRKTGKKAHLGDSKTFSFVKDQSSYTISLIDIKIPRGTYDLNVFVSIQNGSQIADYVKVPYLQIL
jgi:hypothetical protein